MNHHSESTTLCTIRIDDCLYGIDMLAVREANQATQAVRVPGTPPEVLGMVNLRGSLYLLLDIRRLLGLQPRPPREEDLLVVFRPSQGESFGILVDSLDETMVVANRRITPRETDNGTSPISAIVLLDNLSFPMLSPEAMYRRARSLVVAQASSLQQANASSSEK